MKMMKPTLLLVAALAALSFFHAQVLQAEGLPEGKTPETNKGRDLVDSQCSSCHGLEQVMAHRDSKDGWDSVVAYMVSRGMAASDDEVKLMVSYLAESFPATPKQPAAGKAK